MDIVKRAYLKTLEEYKAEPGWPDVSDFEENVRREIIRLIKVRAYSGRDWPRELGPLPDELREKKGKGHVTQAIEIMNEKGGQFNEGITRI